MRKLLEMSEVDDTKAKRWPGQTLLPWYNALGGAVPSVFSFDSATLNAISTPLPLTGLLLAEQILSVDVRPSTAELYGISQQDRLFTIDPATGRRPGWLAYSRRSPPHPWAWTSTR